MRLSQSRICATAILVLLVSVGSGCNLIAKVRAKNELNEAAKAYKEGHFEDAEQHARKALAFIVGTPSVCSSETEAFRM